MDSKTVSYEGVRGLNNLKKKKLKKAISRRTKAIQKYEKERLDKAWMNLFMQSSIAK
ncbi:hypothetical protein bthur0012_54970 [Bacillus thuringiensis serovar pulsiensis BGSC 4CC1]|nr:hypothetical protein bthur0012_54970 [Bacillus thuringiensis serovar pulsiensis BGSC 4CC1]